MSVYLERSARGFIFFFFFCFIIPLLRFNSNKCIGFCSLLKLFGWYCSRCWCCCWYTHRLRAVIVIGAAEAVCASDVYFPFFIAGSNVDASFFLFRSSRCLLFSCTWVCVFIHSQHVSTHVVLWSSTKPRKNTKQNKTESTERESRNKKKQNQQKKIWLLRRFVRLRIGIVNARVLGPIWSLHNYFAFVYLFYFISYRIAHIIVVLSSEMKKRTV